MTHDDLLTLKSLLEAAIVLIDKMTSNKGRMKPQEAINHVLKETGVSMGEIMSDSRMKRVVEARGFMCAFLHESCGLSFPEISVLIGRKGHSTAFSAARAFWRRKSKQKRAA